MTHLDKLHQAYDKVTDALIYEPLTKEMRLAHEQKRKELYSDIANELMTQDQIRRIRRTIRTRNASGSSDAVKISSDVVDATTVDDRLNRALGIAQPTVTKHKV